MLAPISLVAFAVVFLIVVVGSLDGGSDSGARRTSASEQQSGKRAGGSSRARTTNAAGTTGTTGASGNRRVYVVKAGDTLVKIADTTGVPIEELLSLNPSIDPQGLVTGQRVKLRE
jgi:LysM repeat protein